METTAFSEWLQAHEPIVRLGAFLGLLFLLASFEFVRPRRATVYRRGRWLANLGIQVADGLMLRFAFPLLAVDVALQAQINGWGLFNLLAWPAWLELVAAVLVLDVLIYGQHILMHKVPILWRLHRMHHADVEFDVTTGGRFHPIEIALSMLLKMGVVALLGAPVAAVIVFEVVLNATSLFNHSNIRLPLGLDRVLRLFVVTPDMHRVHHSWYPEETNSNYGFNVPWWDRLFRTYCPQPRDGHADMTIGLDYFRDPREASGFLRLGLLLIQPFRAAKDTVGKSESAESSS